MRSTANGEVVSESSVAYTQLFSPSQHQQQQQSLSHNGHAPPPPPPPPPMPSHPVLRSPNLSLDSRPNFNKAPRPFEPYQPSGLERQDSFRREPDSPSGIVEQPLLNVMKGKSMFESSASKSSTSSFFEKSTEERTVARTQ